MKKTISFDLFRYQILPRDRTLQLELFGGVRTIDELLGKKNEMFAAALRSVDEFRTRRSTIRHRLICEDEDGFLFKFAANRSVTLETEEFTEEEVANWPSFLVFIWNEPDRQIIAIQERWAAFQDMEVVAKAIAGAVGLRLEQSNLRAHVEALFFEKAFWDLVGEHKGKIKDVMFELITPNLANISEVLSEELKDFARTTNTAQTNLRIVADPDSSIAVDADHAKMKSLVKYSSEGGGRISLKVRGLSRRVQTKKSKRRVDIDEAIVEGENGEEIVSVLKEVIK